MNHATFIQRRIETAPGLAPAGDQASTGPDAHGLSLARVAMLAGSIWAGFSALTLITHWDQIAPLGLQAWRMTAADAIGAGLSIVVALLMRMAAPRALPGRLALGLGLSLGAVFFYAIVALMLIEPFMNGPAQGAEGAQIFRMMGLNYWVFAVFVCAFAALDEAGPQARADADAHERLRRRLADRVEVYAGLDPRWFWSFQTVFWSVMAVLSTANMVNAGDPVTEAWRILLIEFAGVSVTALAHFAVLRPTNHLPIYQRAVIMLACAVVMTVVYIVALWASFFQIFPVPLPNPSGETLNVGWRFLLEMAPRWMFLNFPVFVGWTGVYMAIDSARRMRQQERQLYNSIMLAQEAQLKMLRFQLNPHFLFNTLNAISTLVLDRRGTEAEAMLSRLSRFLRFTLDAAPDDRTTLARELEAQALYLEIERVRFEARLEVSFDIAPGIEDALVPALILQPLTENAVKYAVARSPRPVALTIAAEAHGDELELSVIDDGPAAGAKPPEPGSGVGLQNTRARLSVLYGARAVMSAGPRPDNGFEVRIRLPLERREAGGTPERSERE